MPVHEILVLITNASSEGSGETVQMRSLTRAFTASTQDVGMYLKAEAKFDSSRPTR